MKRFPTGLCCRLRSSVGCTILGVLCLLLSVSFIPLQAQVVINEIMYHPFSPWGVTNLTEYIELYNAGPSAVDLSTYRFDNGVAADFPFGRTIGPGDYLLVCQDVTAFTTAHPGITNVVGNFEGTLNNAGERLTLSRLEGGTNWITVDTVEYNDYGPSDGDGPSLELINPGFAKFRNQYYGAWAASIAPYTNGSPGVQNSVYDPNPAPVVGDVSHEPELPFPNSAVTITATAGGFGSGGLASVMLKWRKDSVPQATWNVSMMYDNGGNGDAVAGDGEYTIRFPGVADPPMQSGEILEFCIVATDTNAKALTAPATSRSGVTNGPYSYLCMFVEDMYTDCAYPGEYDTYYIIMTASNKNVLQTRPVSSDELLDCTFVTSDGDLFYNSGVRLRGGSSRNQLYGNYRVEFPSGERIAGYRDINLNYDQSQLQYIGMKTVTASGYDCHASAVKLVRVWLGNERKDPPDSTEHIYVRLAKTADVISENYDDDEGNAYTAFGESFGVTRDGDLSYLGTIPEYEADYFVTTGNPTTVWHDLSNLCWAVNQPTSQFPTILTNRMNVRQWARHFAAHVALDNREAGFACPYGCGGDELRLYCDPEDGLFDIMPWDFSDCLGTGARVTDWVGSAAPRVTNFLLTAPMSKFYLHDCLDVISTVMSDTNMNALFDKMGSKASANRGSWLTTIQQQRSNIEAHASIGGARLPPASCPPAPSNLTATNVVSPAFGVQLNWQDNSSEEWFEIERSDDGADWDYIGYVEANVTTFTDRRVREGTVYYYRVRAVVKRGESPYSNVATITTPFATTTALLIDSLRITEIMYNPNDGAGDLHEFIELKNIGASPLNLSGLYFDNGRWAFTNGTILATNAFFVLVSDPVAFADWYPAVQYHGVFQSTDALDDGGERLWIKDALDNRIVDVTYDDGGTDHRWYPTTDGDGYSLVLVDPDGDPNNPATWRASSYPNGSPGEDDPDSPFGRIVINEVLPHTDLPLEDAIELYNDGTNSVNIQGWYLSDSTNNLKMYQITNNITLNPGAYCVFYEGTSFNQTPGSSNCFALSELADSVYLSSATNGVLTSYRTWVKFGASDNGVSFGRYIRSDGIADFPAMSARSFGQDNPASVVVFRTGTGLVNPAPKTGPIVINEIMYNPSAGGKEFVELYNSASSNIPLYHAGYPTNTWRLSAAFDYSFPTNTVMAPSSYALVVSIEPTLFREMFGITNHAVKIFGPFDGALNNGGETIKLYKPGNPETNGFVPQIIVDSVRYDDDPPWPTAADNGGPSLERTSPTAYGNDPTNWRAASFGGTPGAVNNTAGLPTAYFGTISGSCYETNLVVSIPVLLSIPASGSVTVNYAIVGGTASNGSDYTFSNGSRVFTPPQTSTNITLSIIDDGVVNEWDETIEIALTTVTGNATLGGNSTYTFTIIDTDTDAPSIPTPQILPSGLDDTTEFFESIVVNIVTTAPYKVYYTKDGTLPTIDSKLYTNSFLITKSTRIYARAFLGSYNSSAAATTLFLEQTPEFSYGPNTRNTSITNHSDDAEQGGALPVKLYDPTVPLGNPSAGGTWYVGLRFQNVSVPIGVNVTNAFVQFSAAATNSGTISLRIYAERTNNASTFNALRYDISKRNKTTAFVDWSPAAWSTVNERGALQRTPNISALINEITAMPGWTANSAIGVMMERLVIDSARTVYTYDGSMTKCASLVLMWEGGSQIFWLGVITNGVGTITGGNVWVGEGSNATVQASPGQYYQFGSWSGQTTGGDTNNPIYQVLMNQNRTLIGNFNADVASNNTPHWWIETYYPGTNNYDNAALSDLDDDGMFAWQEYQAGTDPTDPASLLRIVGIDVSPTAEFRWRSVSNRLYSIIQSTDLGIPWGGTPVTTNMWGSLSGTNTYSITNSGNGGFFFRVRVQAP